MFKMVKKPRRISWCRDAIFLNDLTLLRAFGLRRVRREASVILGKSPIASRVEYMVARLPPVAPRRHQGLKPRPALWRNTTDQTKLTFIQRALESLGPCYAFTLDLGHEAVGAGKMQERGLVDYVRRRIVRYHNAALGEDPVFWFTIEKPRDGYHHLHGAIRAREEDLPTVRKVLRTAAIEWAPEDRAHQLVMKPVHYGDGAVHYALKGASGFYSDIEMVGSYAVSRPLNAAGQNAYEEDRQLIQHLRFKGRHRRKSALADEHEAA